LATESISNTRQKEADVTQRSTFTVLMVVAAVAGVRLAAQAPGSAVSKC
jgi:hypothetical protein